MLNHNHSRNKLQIGCTLLVGVILSSLLVSGCAPQKPKVYHVGILSGLDYFSPSADGFKAKMAELGYVEGKNIVYDLQKTNEEPDKEKSILKKFIDQKVDLIFVFPTEPAREAKAAVQGTNIPVLFAGANIEGTDLVKNVREPGGNVTRVRFPGTDMVVKNIEIMHELVPQAKRMWVPYLKDYPTANFQLEALRPAATALGITLVEVPVANVAELQADRQAREKSGDVGLDAIILISTPLVTLPDSVTVINGIGMAHKLPIGGRSTNGGLYSVTPDNAEAGRLAAPLADKIFKGVSAGTLPVVSPEVYLRINYKAAQELGLTIPEGLLRQAKEVIR